MIIKPWAKMPSDWIRKGLLATDFTWQGSGPATRSTAIAALQLWVCLVTRAEEHVSIRPGQMPLVECFAGGTYNALMVATGLSRALVAAGLSALQDLQLIEVEKMGRAQQYRFVNYSSSGGWCKLPARALYKGLTSRRYIWPFENFTKRSIVELDALKLYLYFAAVRPNKSSYTHASYKTIQEHAGIPERRIRPAISYMTSTGLLAAVDREYDPDNKKRLPNAYYLQGHRVLSNASWQG